MDVLLKRIWKTYASGILLLRHRPNFVTQICNNPHRHPNNQEDQLTNLNLIQEEVGMAAIVDLNLINSHTITSLPTIEEVLKVINFIINYHFHLLVP
jgi:hypothetical protein